MVEVLQEDKWTTVDPLPAPVYGMQSTLHDRRLYFMGGLYQGTTVYTLQVFFTGLISCKV